MDFVVIVAQTWRRYDASCQQFPESQRHDPVSPFLTGPARALCAASSTMAAAGPKNDPSHVRKFKGWEVVCDTV